MANKIIEQTVPRYKINGISTLTFCSTRAISKPSAVCFGNSSNPPLTRDLDGLQLTVREVPTI